MTSLMARRLTGGSTSCSGRSPAAFGRVSRHQTVRVCALNHDPENLFKGPPQVGIIEKRLAAKMMEKNKDFAVSMARATDDIRRQTLLRREARTVPDDVFELVEFMLNTEAEDMEFEVARCRPRFTPAFFKELDSAIGAERFSPAGAKPDKERLMELETLRAYLEKTVAMVDKAVNTTASAAERMKKLLVSKDKKATILEMAAANEIDQALVDLLQQNIDAAKAAEQTAPAEFMEKVKAAVSKFLVVA